MSRIRKVFPFVLFLFAAVAHGQPASISSFSPTSGVAGTQVKISGSNFVWVTTVTFNGTAAAFGIVSNVEIDATVPHGVTTGPIAMTGVFNPITPVTSATSFTVAAPVITRVGPHLQARGSLVYIDGSNFTDATAVTFADIISPFTQMASPSFTVVNDTRIVATMPAFALGTNCRVSVVTNGGSTTGLAAFYVIPGLIANPTFDISDQFFLGWNPDGPQFTINWNALDADSSPYSASALTTNTYSHTNASARQCVSVTAGTRYTAGGRVMVPAQSDTGIGWIGIIWHSTTGCAAGFITSDFSDANLGRVVGRWISPVVNVAAPAGALSADVLMATWPDHQSSFKAYFDNMFFDTEQVTMINGFSPSLGAPGAQVTISGNNFYGASAVKFAGGIPASFDVHSATEIVATVPAGAATGPLQVVGVDHSVADTGGNEFRIIQRPFISSVTPPSARPNEKVRIDGSDLDVVTRVTFSLPGGWIAADFTTVSSNGITYIQATVPLGAHSGPLTVENPAGIASVNFPITATAADLTGDGAADILLQNQSSGNVAVWMLSGFSVNQGFVFGYPGTAYKVITSGDFNGDGYADVLLQDSTTGLVGVWFMQGSTILAGSLIGSPPPAWRVVGSGDVNGDGKSDVILQNQTNGWIGIWQMNGATITAGTILVPPGPEWRVVGVGDVDSSGTADIVLQSSITSEVDLWQMQGLTIARQSMLATPGIGWEAKAIADFDGDGWADVLLQNTRTNDVAIWRICCLGVTGYLIGNAGPWTVAGGADIDGDGMAEVILYDPPTGTVAAWKLSNWNINGYIIGRAGANWVPITK